MSLVQPTSEIRKQLCSAVQSVFPCNPSCDQIRSLTPFSPSTLNCSLRYHGFSKTKTYQNPQRSKWGFPTYGTRPGESGEDDKPDDRCQYLTEKSKVKIPMIGWGRRQGREDPRAECRGKIQKDGNPIIEDAEGKAKGVSLWQGRWK